MTNDHNYPPSSPADTVHLTGPTRPRSWVAGQARPKRFWIVAAALLALWVVLFVHFGLLRTEGQAQANVGTVLSAIALHMPYLAILGFLFFGMVERIGYIKRARRSVQAGRLPAQAPHVCVQLPMFNEDAVAERAIAAAAAMRWSAGRLSLQVLDDSTDPAIREHVRAACSRIETQSGVPVQFIHRKDRSGYKAGALEAGRRQTNAEFIAIFDADFLPPPDFLERAMPHFYDPDGAPDSGLALVQTQWGHLNDEASPLTAAQAMWVDDHHTLQQSWRSEALGFVNFTGTAGVWRAAAIEAAGGWRSASLVEDCELSFRVLFAGYRTRFVKEIVAPAELPETLAAYRLQQKRWTQGWAQLQRLHFMTLVRGFETGVARKAMLVHMMCIGWQWPLWALWITLLPFLIATGLWAGVIGTPAALMVYVAPPIGFALFASALATVEARATYAGRCAGLPFARMRRFARIVPYLAVNAGMLPHHLCAFVEGLFGPMHAEFERTPKTASVTTAVAVPKDMRVADAAAASSVRRVRLPYLFTEAALVGTQATWMMLFTSQGNPFAALGSGTVLICIIILRVSPALAVWRSHL